MLNYLKLNKFAVTMSAQSRTYNRKFTLQKYEKKLISHLFDQLFLRIFHTNSPKQSFTSLKYKHITNKNIVSFEIIIGSLFS